MRQQNSFFHCRDEVEKLGFELHLFKKTDQSMKSTFTVYEPVNKVEIYSCSSILESHQSDMVLAWVEGFKYQLKEAYQL